MAKGLSSLVVALAIAHGPISSAQAPLRQPSIRVPGTDVVLAEGWSLIYTDGAASSCMYAVPVFWVVSPSGWWAYEPGGAVSIAIAALDAAQWASHRAAVQAAMPAAMSREDTPRRMWLEQVNGAHTWQHVAERDAAHVCAATIETTRTDRSRQVMRTIASTVHVAQEPVLNWITKP